jgi:hypothetical protein
MTKEEILDYITSTPENANRRVLSDMIDELISSSGGGGSSLVPVTLTAGFGGLNITATVSASEVMEGLANGTRYEVFYSEDGATPPFLVGELKLDTSGTEAFAWSTKGGSDGAQDRLSVLFVGIYRSISGTGDLTWYANSTGYYLYLNS